MQAAGLIAGEGIDKYVGQAYGRAWSLEEEESRRALAWLICVGLRPWATHTGTPCTRMCALGTRAPDADAEKLVELSLEIAKHQDALGLFASSETPVGSSLYRRHGVA